jgi:hypothetical protein
LVDDWSVTELVSEQLRAERPALDDGQFAWIIARARADHLISELAGMLTPARASHERLRILHLLGAAADCQSGRGGSPWRGAGPSAGAPAAPAELIDDTSEPNVGKETVESEGTRVLRVPTEKEVAADVTLHEEQAQATRKAVVSVNKDLSVEEMQGFVAARRSAAPPKKNRKRVGTAFDVEVEDKRAVPKEVQGTSKTGRKMVKKSAKKVEKKAGRPPAQGKPKPEAKVSPAPEGKAPARTVEDIVEWSVGGPAKRDGAHPGVLASCEPGRTREFPRDHHGRVLETEGDEIP